MDDRESEVLKCQIEQTRCNLAEKLDMLEERVVEPAATAMTESVTKVKEAVENTAEAVQNTMTKVTETFDLATHVRNYPLRMMGAGVAAGYVLGQFLKPGQPSVPLAKCYSTPLPLNPDPFRNDDRDHSQGLRDANRSITEAAHPQRSDSKASPEGWSKVATEIQGALIGSLAPILQGLLGATLAEFFRRQAAPASAHLARSSVRQHFGEDHDWTDGEVTEPAWGDRLRSMPK